MGSETVPKRRKIHRLQPASHMAKLCFRGLAIALFHVVRVRLKSFVDLLECRNNQLIHFIVLLVCMVVCEEV